MSELIKNFHFGHSALGHLTSAVQFGFIVGTLVFALLSIADRFSPSKVFFFSAVLGSILNLGVIWQGNNIFTMVGLRFATGFFLAGIYPVGMKIAADYYNKELGKALGFLVGALVVGTASPHLLKGVSSFFSWKFVLISTTLLALFGGLLMFFFVPDGPNRKSSQNIDLSVSFVVFKNNKFRSAAFGYFGHMWELYAFWAFVPAILTKYTELHPGFDPNIPILSFCIIAIGGIACILGGYLAQRFEINTVASTALLLSCICCLLSPLMFMTENGYQFIAFLLIWGMVVIMDSPLFSTLVAQNAPQQVKGTALTIVNCIGFAITIISIQLLNSISTLTDSINIYTLLAIGPILGLISLVKKSKKS